MLRTYYHNTISTCKENTTLGYVSAEGYFVPEKEYEELYEGNEDEGLLAKIVVEAGLLSAGESYEDFCTRIAIKVTRCCKYMHEADEDGYTETALGVYLHTQENIIADQKSWDDEDHCKNTDLTTAPYWLDSGNGPEAIHDISDLVKALCM